MDVQDYIKEVEPEIIKFRRKIHQNPELALCESATTSALEAELSKVQGIKIKKYNLSTGLVVILEGENPGKTLALRADMDALPITEASGLDFSSCNQGVMHACGHDIHTSVLLGVVKTLSNFKHALVGKVVFIFQPAEESLQGAHQIIKTGVFEEQGIDAILGLHCWPSLPVGTIGLKAGSFMASSNSLSIRVLGSSSHAAHPHKSIDPVFISGHIITALQGIASREIDPTEPVVITIGKIEAGTAGNIIPDQALMEGTVRTVSLETQAAIKERIARVAEGIASAFKGRVELDITPMVPPLECSPNMVQAVRASAARSIGENNVHTLPVPSMGSEDFANYLEKAKGAIIRLGTSNESEQTQRPLHNSGIVFDEKSIPTGINVLSTFALDYLGSR